MCESARECGSTVMAAVTREGIKRHSPGSDTERAGAADASDDESEELRLRTLPTGNW